MAKFYVLTCNINAFSNKFILSDFNYCNYNSYIDIMNVDENKEEIDKQYSWLTENISPWNEVVKCWTSTTKKRLTENRMKSVAEIYEKWPILENSSGLDLVFLFHLKINNNLIV